jgi:hypothetical protein
MTVLVKARSASLQERSFEELNALPECETEEISVLGKAVSLTTYRSKHNVEQLLIVVQALRETLYGVTAQISVEGFIVSSSGEKVDAAEEMLWDYS